MPFPSSLETLLGEMKFCPKCGKELIEKTYEEDPITYPWNIEKICKDDKLTFRWECDADYDYWMMTIATEETDKQKQGTV